jgi:flagellar basal body-associated protein FliL
MNLKKILIFGGIALVVLGGGVGGAVFFLHHGSKTAAVKPVVPPKPILFAELDNVVVSIPADVGQPATSYVQFGIQFATTNPDAVTAFTSLLPIVKSDVINLMMNETQKTLQDPATRSKLAANCLTISNEVLGKSLNFTPANPFTAAYITNLVVQD